MKTNNTLTENIKHVYNILCSCCNEKKYTGARNIDHAADVFYKYGWRKIAGRVLCPDCLETMRDDGEDGSYNYDNEG